MSERGGPPPDTSRPVRDDGHASVLTTVLVIAAALGALYLVGRLAHVLLLLFGGVLLGVVLYGASSQLADRLGVPRGVDLATILLALVGGGVALGWMLGPPVADQAGQLVERLPEAVASIEASLRETRWGRLLLRNLPFAAQGGPSGSSMLGEVTGIFSTVLGGASNLLIVLAVGLFLAVSPGTYTAGTVRLLPPRWRDAGRRVLHASGRALSWWMLGRLASMTVVGILTTAGLWAVGAPLPLGLGVVAGILSFVPILGPIVSAVPAILVTLPEGFRLALWVVAVFIAVQTVETYLVSPLVQRRAVYLPPALLIVGQVVMGVLFGVLGVLLATPAFVAGVVAVQVLWVEETLGEEIRILGDHGDGDDGA